MTHQIGKPSIIGCGDFGDDICELLNALTQCEIRSVYDVSEDGARGLGRQLGVPAFTAFDECLAKSQYMAVALFTPNDLHCPMALTVEECPAMIEAALTASVKPMVGHKRRLQPQYAKMAEMVKSLGDLSEGSVKLRKWAGVGQLALQPCLALIIRVRELPETNWFPVMYEVVAPATRATAMGVANCSNCIFGGLGVLLGGVLQKYLRLQASMGMDSILALVLLPLALCYFRLFDQDVTRSVGRAAAFEASVRGDAENSSSSGSIEDCCSYA